MNYAPECIPLIRGVSSDNANDFKFPAGIGCFIVQACVSKETTSSVRCAIMYDTTISVGYRQLALICSYTEAHCRAN